ncbi:hypothetical protein [Nocardioides sp. zg-1228]|uniref:hypothetical protein n=1 Tax=Nocardioides sp. zg-1228 TaxID=2763008 RepID=UPI001642942F|nr:hypothetical protein [Nocardioides sp. zg-1228]MBC2932087.1 hypothetical protein [Nocardioides sp. zg-1228]QSF57635.1 hypothetical protein JX575_19265 [Nocardioides sp. zg-1228]
MIGPLSVAAPLWRHNRAWTLAWLGATGVVAAATVPGYSSTYADAATARAALDEARADPATQFLYGRLGELGTPAQIYAWEMGTFLTLIAAFMAVLLAVRLSRALDEDGSLELLLTTGPQRRDAAWAALILLGAVAVGLGLVCFTATAAYSGRIDGVDVAGAATLGLVVVLTFLLVGLVTAVLAMALPTARAARAAGALAVALAIGVRAIADVGQTPALQWVAPMSLRALALPFASDRVLWLVPAVIEAAVLCGVFVRLATANELGASIVRLPQRQSARLRIDSPHGLAWRLDRRRALWSTLLIAAGAALFAVLGAGVIDNLRRGRIDGGFLGAQLSGRDPAEAYFAFSGTIAALVASAVCITLITQVAAAERSGLAEHVRAAGATRSALLRAYVGVAALTSLATLLLCGVASGLIARAIVSGPDVTRDAFWQAVQQWPAVAVVIGLAALAVAAAPRISWIAWVPLLVGGGVTLLGKQLQLPSGVVDLSMFGHTSAGLATSTGVAAQLVLAAVAASAVVAALAAVTRRDLAA